MTDQTNNLDLELAIAAKQAEEAQAQAEATRQRLQQLKEEQERRLNDPKERAKMLKNANDMIDAGIEDYKSKGYSCEVSKDDYGIIFKITIKIGKPSKSGTRGPRKSASEGGSTPGMTASQFSDIYESLGQTFTPKDIVEKLVAQFGKGVVLKYNPQPTLGKIVAKGHEKIKIEKIGTKGPGVYYKKIS
jgi:hypothetical protein